MKLAWPVFVMRVIPEQAQQRGLEALTGTRGRGLKLRPRHCHGTRCPYYITSACALAARLAGGVPLFVEKLCAALMKLLHGLPLLKTRTLRSDRPSVSAVAIPLVHTERHQNDLQRTWTRAAHAIVELVHGRCRPQSATGTNYFKATSNQGHGRGTSDRAVATR